MSKVNKDAFNSIKSSSLDELTLSELGIAYKNWICENKGKHGVCWEYYIYHAIKHGDEFIQEMINESINLVAGCAGYDDIDVLLWGGEKRSINTENIRSIVNKEDVIWTNQKVLNFHKYIEIIHKAFNDKNIRKQLPKFANDIWKTDLFVKKRKDNVWFAVSVKWNKKEIKSYCGINIGIVFNNCSIQGNNSNPEVYMKNGILNMIVINIYHFIAQYFLEVMRFANNVLLNINVKSSQSNVINFPTIQEINMFKFLKNNRHYKCYDIINYLEETLKMKNKKVITDEIIAKTGERIYIPSKKEEIISDFKILPKYLKNN